MRLVDRILEHEVWVAGLELNLRDGLKKAPCADLLLTDARVADHLIVDLGDIHIGKRLAIDALHIIRRKQVHVPVGPSKFKGHVGDYDTEGKSLDSQLLISVLSLSVQKLHNVRMMSVQIHRTSALTLPQLVSIGEGVLKHLHNGNDAG